jgi:hypothetical protein
MQRARALAAHPFEVIVGSPRARFGARITFELRRASAAHIAHELGLRQHEWGPPSWLGLRVTDDGVVEWKSYHAASAVRRDLSPPDAAPAPLVAVMAALHDGRFEVYYRLVMRMPWKEFAAGCAGLIDAEAPLTSMPITPAVDAFCLSLSWKNERLHAVSIFADDRALPSDSEIMRVWRRELPVPERPVYDAALAGIRSAGRRPARGWHAMLAWTYGSDGSQSRAVSFRLRTDSRMRFDRSAGER